MDKRKGKWKWKPMRGKRLGGICPIHNVYYSGDKCVKCVEMETRKVAGPAIHIWKPMMYNDICEKPLWIESKAQLRRECKKHGVIAARLL